VERVLLSFADITDLREAERDARHRADHDALTGLANRARLRRWLDEALAAAREARRDAAVLFFDLDRFKVINDSLGHRAGDALLVAAAQRLQGELRGADVLARFGGDEFVVVAADVEGEAGAAALADRLLGVLGAPFVLDGAEHVVRASAGIALAPGGEGEAEDLLRGADLAMYRAKEEGRGRHALFDKAMLERAVAQLSLEGQLRHAVARRELELHYQPICALPGRGLAAVEALVRWRHAERGLVPPAEFIPIAEQSGLIVEIGDWVLGEACRQLAEWRRDAPGPPPMVSVNVSARQLDDPGFPSRVRACLDEHALEPRMLALEVTETLLMARPDRAGMCLDALRALGVRLILDDFGTGYSSLSRLSRLPLDTFKVDRSFVAALHEPAERAIVQMIFSMASALGLRVVAEGVETEDQLALLEELGCRLAQGYLLGRPVPPAELAVLLARPRLFEPAG
jgi:diguanylate cyclase (GGDEF)-like protein